MAHIVRNATKTIYIKAAIYCIFAHDIADFKDGLFIRVHLSIRTLPVQRIIVSYLEIAQREVDRN